jgi:hypothetical protein
MGDQLGGPEYALLVPIHRAANPSGEVGLSAAAADVTPAKLVALLGRSVVGCALAPRIHQTPSTPRRPADSNAVRSGLRPRVVGDAPGVVARSDVTAVPDGAGQGGGPVMGHDGGHGGVDPPGRVLPLLGQPGTASILPQYRVPDVAGQAVVS